MKQKKQKKLIFWLGIIIIGIALGFALQFVRAWTEPTQAPPGGNLGAPINTGPNKQVKQGDICTTVTGEEKCLSTLVSFPACTLKGGIPTMFGAITLCKFPGSSCPSGWKRYLNYTETTANNCVGGGSCATSVASGSHSFDNIDPATEARSYQDGSQTAYNCNPYCVDNCACWCNGYHPDCRCCCGWGYSTCYTDCSSTVKACNSTLTAIGCVPN